ncbi:pyridoxal phosphate-dependent decarboxylase family protein [Actinacidiphila oryziradicis]|uniref:Aminotransferase class V-fold PLP-dependent enzyme n=1 Tax=Actinacidiphila oryziradicis TaxID=2571141 RepID=A0A4U0SIL4_9ACTN|nr:aminotransferase class V-fold PLP-dependent enzyme [Actinacidiphila oryziradicis]TKA09570.1 aminotransferase class V-fold PLP-dependent enzyme [Actinacidiphila oryziradicis]
MESRSNNPTFEQRDGSDSFSAIQRSRSSAPITTGAPQSGLLLDAFDAKLLRDNSETAVSRLEDHLADLSVRGLDLIDPAALSQAARALMTTEHESIAPFDEKRLNAIIDLYIRTGIQVHSPGYMGRQFSGVVPLGGVIDFVSAVVNQPSSFYEAAQLPNVAERIMADELNRFIGWDPGSFAMVTTSGGSLANLTALLAARNKMFPDFWSDGSPAPAGRARPAIAVGADAHYSVSRAAGIMGIGEGQIVRLPINRDHQICMDRARPTLDEAERRGLKVFCLVASAGTTSVGAFDPIDELGDLAREKNIWLHVDGAHGASLLVSDKLRRKLEGIEKVDSLAWDAHKLMFVPAPCTLLFYRNKKDSLAAFRQEASYVFTEDPDIYTELDSGDKNFECTKRPMIMALWALWAVYGRALFAEKIEYLCELTEEIHRVLVEETDFETAHRPEANILCFRYRPNGVGDKDVHRFQLAITDRIKRQGNFFISKVNIDGTAALRVVVMNHRITTEHFRMLLDEIRRVGRDLLRSGE